jgi:MFS family permease/ribosomal protein L37E
MASWLMKPGSILTLCIPALLFCIGLFITYPLLGLIFVDIICNKDSSRMDDDCSSTDISQKASQVLFYGTLAADLPALFLLGIYSSMADKWGRRVALLLPCVGYLAYFGGLFVIALLKPDAYVEIYVVCCFICGCCGSYSTYFMGLFAYLADITRPSERTSKYSRLGTAMLSYVATRCYGLLLSRRGRHIYLSNYRSSGRRILGSLRRIRRAHVICRDCSVASFHLDSEHARVTACGRTVPTDARSVQSVVNNEQSVLLV